MRLPALFLAAALVASACSSPAPAPSQAPAATAAPGSKPAAPPADRKYLLERVDDAAVVQLYADGFSSLPLKEKTLVWHLYQAALAGRDIFIDQKHRSSLEMRGILEQIVANPTGVDAATLADVQRYTKLFWLNNGPYNNLTARKFVLTCTPQSFAAAVKASASAGATFATRPGESIDQMLARLQPMFFDPKVDPIVTNKNPGAGKDILQASANNLYSNVVMADLKGFAEKYGLNSRLTKRDGKLVEEVYRADGTVREADHRDHQAPRGGAAVRDRADGEGAGGPRDVLQDRRGRRPREVRHRLGAGQGVAGGHDQRVHRGLPGSAWHQGRLGGAGLLRQPGEDGPHQEAGGERAVVRGPHALGSQSTASRTCRALSPTPSTSWSRPAIRARSRRLASTCRTTRPSARSSAASRWRCRTSTRPTTCPRRARCAVSSRGRRRKWIAPRSMRSSRPSSPPTCTR